MTPAREGAVPWGACLEAGTSCPLSLPHTSSCPPPPFLPLPRVCPRRPTSPRNLLAFPAPAHTPSRLLPICFQVSVPCSPPPAPLRKSDVAPLLLLLRRLHPLLPSHRSLRLPPPPPPPLPSSLHRSARLLPVPLCSPLAAPRCRHLAACSVSAPAPPGARPSDEPKPPLGIEPRTFSLQD